MLFLFKKPAFNESDVFRSHFNRVQAHFIPWQLENIMLSNYGRKCARISVFLIINATTFFLICSIYMSKYLLYIRNNIIHFIFNLIISKIILRMAL